MEVFRGVKFEPNAQIGENSHFLMGTSLIDDQQLNVSTDSFFSGASFAINFLNYSIACDKWTVQGLGIQCLKL